MGLAAAILIGAIIGAVTSFDARLRIADELPLSVLVCVSGAVAAWAVLYTLGATKDGGVSVANVVGALLGAAAIATAAWRGRRRTLSELG